MEDQDYNISQSAETIRDLKDYIRKNCGDYKKYKGWSLFGFGYHQLMYLGFIMDAMAYDPEKEHPVHFIKKYANQFESIESALCQDLMLYQALKPYMESEKTK